MDIQGNRQRNPDRDDRESRCEPDKGICAQEIDRRQWADFLNDFSRDHLDNPVAVEVRGDAYGGAHMLSHHSPLLGLVAEPEKGVPTVEIILGQGKTGPFTHVVRDVRKMWRQQDDAGREILQMISADGTSTVLTVGR